MENHVECWICGEDAKTGEHLVKASDLRSEFGQASQKEPLYIHTKNKINQKLNSIKKGSIIKSNALICACCNNARTAPHDKAWEKLSEYIRSQKSLYSNQVIKLNKIFPGKTKTQMLNVHLYFAKLFGCAIKEFDIPIELTQFQRSILQGEAHPNLYISCGLSEGMITGNTDIQTASLKGKIAFATWFYVVGSLAVNVMYALPSEKRHGIDKAWHPDSITKKLRLVQY